MADIIPSESSSDDRSNTNSHTNLTSNSASITHNSSFEKPNQTSVSFEEKESKGLSISRAPFTKSQFDIHAAATKSKQTPKEWLKSKLKPKAKCECSYFCNKFLAFFPFLTILASYKRSDFFSDLVAGLTVGVMHIPQGMAYGLLANLPPIYGLYTSFFPVLFYFFFGTSRHVSIGTFAVVSLMIGAVVTKADCDRLTTNSTTLNSTAGTALLNSSAPLDTSLALNCKVEVAVTTTFAVGIIHLVFAVFRVGIVSEYLPSSVTRSLTFGAAFHIFTSQMRHVFGYSLGSATGILKLIKRYQVFFTNLYKINWAAVVIALIFIVIIYLVQRFINPKAKEKIKMPVPIEFILLVIGTAISYGFKFSSPDVFNIIVVGDIPKGFPPPQLPAFWKLGDVMADAIAIAVVSFIVSYSMGKLFADLEKYHINSNQELVAYAIMNIGSSFFNSYVGTASLSRSYVQYMAGGKTQVASLVSCILLVVVIMAVGPLFHDLPNCVLAAIIIVNLKGVFLQILDLKYHFRVSKYDGLIFVVTSVAIILTDVDIGLAIGLAFTFFTVVLRTQRPKVRALGWIPETECYVDLKKFSNATELGGIKILSIDTSLYYANQAHFLSKLNTIMNVGDGAAGSKLNCCAKKNQQDETPEDITKATISMPTDLIIDCSHISFVDSDAISAVNKIVTTYKAKEITVSLAGCSNKVYGMMRRAMEMEKMKEVDIYLSVHDAVVSIKTAHLSIKSGNESNI